MKGIYRTADGRVFEGMDAVSGAFGIKVCTLYKRLLNFQFPFSEVMPQIGRRCAPVRFHGVRYENIHEAAKAHGVKNTAVYSEKWRRNNQEAHRLAQQKYERKRKNAAGNHDASVHQ